MPATGGAKKMIPSIARTTPPKTGSHDPHNRPATIANMPHTKDHPPMSACEHWLVSKFVLPVEMLLSLALPIMIMNSLCTFGFAQFRLNVVHKHSLTQLQFKVTQEAK